MLHNLEEIMTIEGWFKKIYPRISRKIPSFAQKEMKKFEDITAAQFSAVVFVFSIASSILILIAAITQYYFLFFGLNLLFALNMFTHPLQALYLRCYTPGLWTALFLIIPYNIVFFNYFSKAGFLTMNTILGSLLVMLFLISVFFLSHKVGEKWG
ncbi:HXXEE domain-containing protein [Virgibacillus dakarensis]|nr:HXXEE domain-containing protein [Virgibacillus dakarensis]